MDGKGTLPYIVCLPMNLNWSQFFQRLLYFSSFIKIIIMGLMEIFCLSSYFKIPCFSFFITHLSSWAMSVKRATRIFPIFKSRIYPNKFFPECYFFSLLFKMFGCKNLSKITQEETVKCPATILAKSDNHFSSSGTTQDDTNRA